MIQSYLPILKAKTGELKAVSKMSEGVKDKILPLFEVSTFEVASQDQNQKKGTTEDFLDDGAICTHLDKDALQIAKVWRGRTALVDAYRWDADATTETGEHVLPYIYAKLRSYGVVVVPVIGYDRWDSQPYKLAMQGWEMRDDDFCCLRLDSDAIEDSADPEFFEDRVMDMINTLNLSPQRCAILIDFGDIAAMFLDALLEQAQSIIDLLDTKGFMFFAITGCSLPASIDKAVSNHNSTGRVLRKEMLLWQTIKADHPKLRLLFGDYGVRGPNTKESGISTNANGKIRYTTGMNYYIARGHKLQKDDKGGQMHKLAEVIVNSPHYMGKDFSWGDAQILECSQKKVTGNLTNWVSIDTNHHTALVVAEMAEFETSLVPKVVVPV